MMLENTTCADARSQLQTIADWLRWCTSQLQQSDVFLGHGTDNPWDESVALVLQSLHLPFDLPDQLYHARLTDVEKQLITERLQARINDRIPLAYLTNQAYFCQLPFYVDERVLVPRSPIAELIENQFAPFIDPAQVHSILDLCTGSGCIAIACATYFEEAFVAASDISTDALEVAEFNIEQHGLQEQMGLLQSDCFDSIPKQQFDLIVFNIPFHNDDLIIEHPLEYAFYDPNFISVKNFLTQAKSYCSEHSQIVIAFSNKGDVYGLEDQFAECGYEYYLWQIANQSDAHDNRLYILRSR